MTAARSEHTATLLSDGWVLIAGGGDAGFRLSGGLASAEIYTPPNPIPATTFETDKRRAPADLGRCRIALKSTDRAGRVRLYWFKPRDVSRFFCACENRFIATALKYAIPKEKYKEYGVLER